MVKKTAKRLDVEELIPIGMKLQDIPLQQLISTIGILTIKLSFDTNGFRLGSKDIYIEGRHTNEEITTITVRDYTESNLHEAERARTRADKILEAKTKKDNK